jgi:hypothetical protein
VKLNGTLQLTWPAWLGEAAAVNIAISAAAHNVLTFRFVMRSSLLPPDDDDLAAAHPSAGDMPWARARALAVLQSLAAASPLRPPRAASNHTLLCVATHRRGGKGRVR